MRRVDRARANTKQLIECFPECLAAFEAEGDGDAGFAGASVYFHERTLERRGRFAEPRSLVEDTCFMEYVFATLCAWGMHHTGKHPTRLAGFDAFCASYRADGVVETLESLWDSNITSLAPSDADRVGTEVWSVIERTEVSASETRLVAGSKALHHVLPNLVPPIDRRYTISFFIGNTPFIGKPEFDQIFPRVNEIALACAGEIAAAIARRGFMETGPAKVIDNAIVGFGYLKLGV
jgi:hypothetical protein